MSRHYDFGLEMGRLIERQRAHEDSAAQMRTDLKEVRKEVTEIRVTLQRAAWMLSLWGAAIGLISTNERVADLVVSLIRAATGKG